MSTSVNQIEAALEELELDKTHLDLRAVLVMLSLKLGPQITMGEVRAALRLRIAKLEAGR